LKKKQTQSCFVKVGPLLVILFCLTSSSQVLEAQIIKADVGFHTEQLPREEQEYLANLDKELMEAINSHIWVERGNNNIELPLRIDLFFEKYSRSATYRRYGSGIMVGSRSGVQLRDNRWDFRYSSDFRTRIGETENTLSILVEFYIWICIGFERDRFAPLGGQPYYEKAKLIAENAQFELDYIRGWDRRRDFIRDLSLDKYRNIRLAAHHAAAGQYYSNKQKIESARTHLSRAVELMLDDKPASMELHRDDHIIRFINTVEFVAALNQTGSDDLIEQLEEWDSAHPERYK